MSTRTVQAGKNGEKSKKSREIITEFAQDY